MRLRLLSGMKNIPKKQPDFCQQIGILNLTDNYHGPITN